MIDITGSYTDQYQLTMAQVYHDRNEKNETAVFDYFFRKLPYNSGYAVFAGLETVLEILEQLRFDEKDIVFLRENNFKPEFIEYLKDFRFSGTVYASREGDLVFPARPVLTVEADIIEAQIVETLLLNILNFQSLIATKASRMRSAAGKRTLIDFGMRRAHGTGAYHASRAAVIGGFDATSNVRAGRDFNIPVSGTMAHSFVQSFDSELDAFQSFAKGMPDNCVLLVDTYDTLKSGIPNAVQTAKEMEKEGKRVKGIRLDSGDLAYLSKQARKMLDEAGLEYVKIAASNQLDEHVIKSLIEQEAPIDLFGVGTNLVTGNPDAAFDGVYKLAYSGGKPRIKLSENNAKITLPHKKQVHRIVDNDGNFMGADAVSLRDETEFTEMHHPFEVSKSFEFKGCRTEKTMSKVMENGERVSPAPTLDEIKKFSENQKAKLPDEYKRFDNPHIYKVGLTSELKDLRNHMINEFKNKK